MVLHWHIAFYILFFLGCATVEAPENNVCAIQNDNHLITQISVNEAVSQLYQEGVVAFERKDWDAAIQKFQLLNYEYPQCEKIERSKYYLIKSLFNKKSFELTIRYADQFVERYPDSDSLQEILAMRAKANICRNLPMLLFGSKKGEPSNTHQYKFDTRVKRYRSSRTVWPVNTSPENVFENDTKKFRSSDTYLKKPLGDRIKC